MLFFFVGISCHDATVEATEGGKLPANEAAFGKTFGVFFDVVTLLLPPATTCVGMAALAAPDESSFTRFSRLS